MAETLTCPTCGNAKLLSSDGGLFCRNCWQTVDEFSVPLPLRATYSAQTLDHDQSIGSEKALVQAIREALTCRGWRVYRIGQHVVKNAGSDPGCPDLLVIKPACKPYPAVIRLIEVKFGRNRPTKEQQEVIDTGAARAVWSVAEALEYCGEGEEI